jgi:hypothetical protein
MKKNVIRLTEAELKQYISKVVKEQTADPAAAGEANKQKAVELSKTFVGKNVQLYLDMGKTQKSHIVNVTNIGASTNSVGVFFFYVKDLAFVTSTGGAATPQDSMGAIQFLRFDCKAPNGLVAVGEAGKGLGTLYCPPFTELVKTTAACATIDKTPQFASAGSGVQSNMAETVRVDIG